MTNQVNGLTYDDLLIIASRAMVIDMDEDEETIKYVSNVCRLFREAIPVIVEKLELREKSN